MSRTVRAYDADAGAGVVSQVDATLLGMTHDPAHDPVLALVRSHLDTDPGPHDPRARARDDALADVQRHPAVLVDTVLQLAELCATLAQVAADRSGQPPEHVVETSRGLLRMVADEHAPLRLVGAPRAG